MILKMKKKKKKNEKMKILYNKEVYLFYNLINDKI